MIDDFIDYHSIDIIDVTEYKNTASPCSEDSYYKCLANRFSKLDLRTMTVKTTNGTVCHIDKKCLPFPMPLDDIHVCENEIDKECFSQVLWDMRSDQERHCKRSCQIKEFTIAKSSLNTGGTQFDVWRKDPYKIVLAFGFASPKVTKNSMSEKLFKNVNTEYLIMNLWSLIGNVGGTLGVFVGFCFIGISDWLIDLFFEKCWKFKKSKANRKRP